MTDSFSLDIDDNGVAVVVWDAPGQPFNLIDLETIAELDQLAGRFASDPAISGIVLTSAKDGFCNGADIAMLQRLADPDRSGAGEVDRRDAFARLKALSVAIRRIETCGKPVVAALPGTAVGGGYEIALGCHHRMAAASPDARFGLPEARIGLLPGAGGTQRLSRMLGAAEALRLMLKGQTLTAEEAHAAGLIDVIVPKGDLVETAKQWLRSNPDPAQPWDVDGFQVPGGAPYSRAGYMTFSAANALYRRETQDNYPGLRALLRAVFEGLQVDIDTGLRIEARLFLETLQTREARAMLRSQFISLRSLRRGVRRPASEPPTRVGKLGILGAGMMGSGIAYVAATAGIDVVLVDRDRATAESGRQHAHTLMSGQIDRGRATETDRDAVLDRIQATDRYHHLRDSGLVIEAVFEDRTIKADVTARAGEVVGETAIFASNTSTLPITGLAAASGAPENFIGLHFFSPVHKMALVEVILGELTSDRALATALDFVKAIGKTPIVVNDSRGFFTTRVVVAYIGEGHAMINDGVPPAMVENLARQAGMPVGPLALNDEIGLDLALRISRQAQNDLGSTYVAQPWDRILEDMVDDRGRLGRKNGKGFYDYPKSGRKQLWPGLSEVVSPSESRREVDTDSVKDRFLTIQALETARCFEGQVLTDVRDGDVGAILGFGFPSFTGGPLSYIDGIGASAFVERCDRLAEVHGERYTPCDLLRDMAANGDTFYDRFAPDETADGV